MNMIGQRTKLDGLARLARPWQATLALTVALLAGTGTAAAQDTMPPGLEYARIDGTTLTLRFDKPVGLGMPKQVVHGFTVAGISDSASVHPTEMKWNAWTATLEFDTRAEPGQTVTVSYDPDEVPNSPPTPEHPNGLPAALVYTDGTLVPKFSDAPVTILAPKPATDLTFSNQFGLTVDLSWTPPVHPEGVVAKVVVDVSSDSLFYTIGRWAIHADSTSITMMIQHGWGYTDYFRVRYLTDNYHADSEVATWTSTQEGLKAPTGLTASNATQTTVDLVLCR